MKNEKFKKEFEKESKMLPKFYSENYVQTHTVDRAVVVVKKKRPYMEWIRNLPDPDTETTLESINDESSTYLIPSCEDNVKLLANLSSLCHEIFAREMGGWWTKEKDWEKDCVF